MKDEEILRALQTGTIAAVAASTMPELPIKAVGRTFTVPDDQKYLELVFIPNNRGGDFWGNEKNYQGLFRLVLHWPNDDQGIYGPMGVLASIAGYFTKGLRLQKVQIYETPNLTGILEEGSEMLLPASIRYQSYQRS